MSTLTIEMPDTPEIREGDEVTIRARMKGSRLVAETVRNRPAVETEEQAAARAAAMDELLRLRDASPVVAWTDEDLDRIRLEGIKKKHLR